MLYVPGSDLHKCEKALASESDSVIFDLEDSVSPSMKQEARGNVCDLLQKYGTTSKKELIVRINQVSTLTGVEDIMAVARYPVDVILVPKACTNDVIVADSLITSVEQNMSLPAGQIRMIGLIETAFGLEQLAELLRATCRLDGLQLGAEDLTKELEIIRTSAGSELTYARNRMVVAARAFGADAIDTPYSDFKDIEGLKADIATCRQIGMLAKTAIHPGQIEAINTAFTPTEAEVSQARRIVDAFEEALAKNLGAISLDGKMIDAPIAERARSVVKKASLLANL
jgi:citrate lyase subunit beta/citryl-CoA lyase